MFTQEELDDAEAIGAEAKIAFDHACRSMTLDTLIHEHESIYQEL
ncbi:hypothetical protein RYA05_01905 [Pseudomonas syringae pv. actinidiae]|nr:hypothetical protein [Pseudomonas syringae pv. actinidiae]